MVLVERMDSFTLCCAKHLQPKWGALACARRLLAWWCRAVLLGLMLCTGVAQAESDTPPQPLTVTRTADGLYLSARLPLELPAGLQDVLYKGVPLHFVWQADLLRSRWYWWDETLASHKRVVRLAYQPLTRRWRLSVDNGAADELPGLNALHQTVDSLDEALALVARVSSWRLTEGVRLQSRETYRLDFVFYLDSTRLPRPLQIGPGNGSGLSFRFEQQLTVPPLQLGSSDLAGGTFRLAGSEAVP